MGHEDYINKDMVEHEDFINNNMVGHESYISKDIVSHHDCGITLIDASSLECE